MKNILAFALNYLSQGIPAIPSDPKTKIPLVKWTDYQSRLPTQEETISMFRQYPKSMISLVTGKISNLLVVDADSEDAIKTIEDNIPDSIETTIDISPRGGRHYWWLMNGKQWQTKSAVLKNIDIRANGGVIVAPPSRNDSGGQYRWLTDLDFDKSRLQDMPESLCKLLESAQVEHKPKFVVDLKSVEDLYKEGRRDSDLFHLALALRKSGESREYVLKNLMIVAKSWGEEKEIEWFQKKVASAFQHEEKKERNLAEEVREWVTMATGNFSVMDIHRELNLIMKEQKHSVNNEISKLAKDRIIEKYGEKRGYYRLVNTNLDELNWKDVKDVNCFDISFPFQIESYVKIHKKSIIVVAGTSNSGKTAFMLNTIKLNMHKQKVIYFSSELAKEEMAERIRCFGLPDSDWNFNSYSRSSNFEDVINPEALNIIDFLEIYEDFFKIGKTIAAIHQILTSGVAVIALQKNFGTKTGLGGERSIEKARLYLTVDPGNIKITKGKSWANRDKNPNGLSLNFKLLDGCKFMPQSGWILP